MKHLANTMILLLVAAVASAQSEGNPSFVALDVDEDNRISREEAQADAQVAARFEEADTDQDGYLSLEEFIAVWK